MIEMTVAGIAVDARNGHPIVILNDPTGQRALPIWIGIAEATAIGRALEDLRTERPMTHDLMLNIIGALGYRVKEVEINEFLHDAYLATIRLVADDPINGIDPPKNIDARPSDAIALALRARAPVFVAAEIVHDNTIPMDYRKEQEEAEEFRRFVEGLKASDFKLPASHETDQKEGGGGEGQSP